ncbi:Dynein beta chain, flagellar outer arm [Cymbomonas tetramitiformis]|uniref:Dynein beta chain, flagellar outer arm n=2 Tax=Cymbomonas tetramitiformis TaxID=36881 RepID=A0AAE0F7T3_9CHLO|nr:Dynein beta chain, flagellar outer arm [Cymbomonas tetramitiformis]
MAEGAGAVDKRVAFISSRLCTAFKCEMDKFQALMMKDESRVTIEQFLGDPDVRKFICYEVGKGDLVACTKPPSKFKKKSVYFLKVNAGVELAVDNMDSEVVFGEFSEAPLEFLSASMQEVYLPLLCHHRNQEGWPEVICKEVTDNAHKCIANVYVTVGQTKGKTLLPLPPSEGGADPGGKPNARDKKQIHVLESAVVTWTRQIKNVLKTDPEGALQAGQDPGPLTELEFWTGKAANLHSIYEQLSGPKIRKVIRVLELTKSTYFPSFNRLCKEVAHARVEAQSNVSYLNPLRRYFDRLNMSDEFKELEELFKPIFHMLMLLWSKSKYYNSAARLVVLVREICNDLIQQARTFIDGEEIFKSLEPAEAVSKLQTTLKVCGTFKSYYFDYKAKVGVENPDNPWKFQNSSLFSRLDSFLERCHDIYDLAQIVVQFNKLEKIEVGGTLGKTLTVTVREIFDEFITSFSKFQEITYDITDVENNQFDDDFYQFRTKIKELERQLGAVISQAFDDCTTIAATFKLMDAFEGLLDREIIQADLERKHIDLMRAYGREVITVQNIFTSCKDKPLTPKNSAPRSGAVYWVRGLKTRVEEPMAKLKSLSKMAMETDEAKEIVKNYNALIASLAAYETTTTEIWCGEIESTSDEKLKLPLLVRTPENAIRVNFDPLLLKLLREVKYFLQLGIEVPENSLKIYKRGESFRQQTGNLDLIANIYNEIQNTMLDVERPLVIQKLETIDQHLHQGLNVLNWNSLKIEEYIVEVMSMLKELHEILILIKSNVTKTEKILDRWEQNVMFARKDGRVYTTEEFSDSFKTTLSTRYGDITDGGLEIAKLLSLTNKTLKVSKGAVAWKTYTEFVNEIVIDGFSRAINATLKYVETQIDPDIMAKNETQPLLEISLELVAPEVVWVPDIGLATGGTGIRDMFNGWVKSFVNIGNLVKRLDISEGNYTKEIDEDFEVSWHISRLYGLVLQNEERCAKFKESYDVYSYLWKNDLKESLAQFLDENGKENAEGGKDEPELKIFDDKIAELKNVQTEVQALPSSMVIGWLKVDSKPVKQALGTWLTKWIFLFTQHLSNRVVQSMDDLYQFMGAADQVLDTHSVLVKPEPEEGEEDAPPAEEEIEEDTAEKEEGPDPREVLYNVMGCMRDIRKRQEKTDAMFDPLQQCVLLLKKYGITLNDKTLKALEEAPMTWGGIKKKMLNVREKLSNEQQAEARAIRETSDNFAMKVEDYRKYFQATAPFAVEESTLKPELCDPAYVKLDHFHHGEAGDVYRFGSVTTIMDESKSLNESQELFELFVSDYIALRRCSEELGYLKNLWDQVSSVMFTFSDWYSTPWDKIDTEFLTDETKKLAKDIKTLNKNVRNYEVYKMLEETIKAMLTSLPLVNDLHHPAMRDRHWKQLMAATGKHFVMDANFNLGALLALELHTYADAVSEIVDRAQKELIIEKAIAKIDDTWSGLNLTFVPYQESEVQQMCTDDLIIEALETDNLALQNMSSGKYVQGNPKFLELVTGWQKKLGTVDTCLTTWGDVQKKWQALESIFVGSADIRVQLPEDSKRFDVINLDFQDLMRVAPEITNCVEACNLEGRLERLENLLSQLELCEKALQDYLETKRIAFPRFYFVAPADLLDILSKGSNPQHIIRHLPKCFDNLANLKFRLDEKGEPTKYAIGMYSKEKEYVDMDGEVSCDGAVESWLQNVVDGMRDALRLVFKNSVIGYDEKPRAKWLFDQCAQLTVAVTRVFYTSEVNEAFDQLEEGNDNALKDLYQKECSHLAGLIELINGELTGGDRKKIVTLCTIDVHARDVVQRLIDERVEVATQFQWQSQLRYSQNEKTKQMMINICDAEIEYQNEYVGNCGCLVITPLTDRCYITLTQAQRLFLGGAPAGPAGTGKTESVKDLGRALGIIVYVFNCSDQMDFRVMGQIYKGLAQTGAWGCFDEFNRIPVSVLSVCSTQYKTVLDAIRSRKEKFNFEEIEISLRPTVMAFITMNPGYPGRAELPESLKALFRPVSMCVPDLIIICEIMLMAEGFMIAKLLARKFVILYKLCEDLLSKSAHYDWKLRAIKTTLYVAGGMKRDQPHLTEDKVLLQALRDFNLGKLTSDDTGIFVGLLNDLFPKLMELVPRRVNKVFEDEIAKASVQKGLQPEDMFCLKITQLREIFEVRWSVFLLGPAGSGKTAIWQTLKLAQNNFGEKTVHKPINPKAVTRNELYGFLHPSTREWKEGLISVNFRDMANNTVNMHQWIVLDGDIDAEWIESMNTVMDDNKMLTLASNERIPLTGTMRLLLEINHMVHCSPATVSRGGVIFVNAEDIGWAPVVDSWINSLEDKQYVPLLIELFGRYMDKSLEHVRRNFKTVCPLPLVNQAQSVCKILEGIIPKEPVRGAPPPDKKLMEYNFVFAVTWALGGAMFVDKVTDYRLQFSKWWVSEWKNVAYPEKGLVFDFYVDEKQIMMVPWSEKVETFQYQDDINNFGNLFVSTVETTRLTYFLDSLIENKHYVMFVGTAGTGKTALMANKLRGMDPDLMCFTTINLNSFSDASSLQVIMEQPLEKKSGVRFGPPGARRLVMFFDDMNMPYVDKYDTQSPIELARQYVDYQGWFDKVKIVLKEVLNTQLSACMNPTAGSFNITPRMQRHFTTFAVQMPVQAIVRTIYGQMVESHMSEFDSNVAKYSSRLVDAAIDLHKAVSNAFLPSAIKFHYQWNLRELTNISQGLCRQIKESYTDPLKSIRLWLHECESVFRDRMVSEADMTRFDELRIPITKKFFEDADQSLVEERPCIYTAFINFTPDDLPIYDAVTSYEALKKVLDEQLQSYNENNAAMELVLFQQAMQHVCKIARIISLPRGNAMLVGVGGSGKQSLARLASFICQYEVFQISVTGTYGINDFKENLLALYTKAGVKSIPTTFLMTDGQIVKEHFLVYINDFLSSGIIPDLMTQEDKDNMCNAVRNEVKQAGIVDTMENLWDFFIDKVRKFLHFALCFSPVGDKFRVRARQFPALINNTVIDWFQPWPHEALVSVAGRFLADIPNIEDNDREQLTYHMAAVHLAVTDASINYLARDRRYYYTTPKSYLELIALYKSLLGTKRDDLRAQRERLENGVAKIAQASAQVNDLQVNLKQEQIIVAEKKAATDALIVNIGQEKAVVDEAVEASRGDEEACSAMQAEVETFAAECEQDLKAAEPVIAEAEAALNSLDKKSLGELKSFGSPAAEVVQVASACIVLTSPGGKIPKDLSWNAGKKMMNNVDQFLKSLIEFDKDNLPEICCATVEKQFMCNPNFNPDYIRSKSGAAAGLCGWVVNICKYFRIYQVVAPKRAALAEANKRLESANKKLSGIRAKVKELQDRVDQLEEGLMKATEDKNKAVQQAEKTQKKADLADRLVNGLSGENKRWGNAIAEFGIMEGKLVGDVILASAFVSYAGCFNSHFRQILVYDCWMVDLKERQLPLTEGIVPLDILSDVSARAQWANEGLPTDPLSIENGAIMTNAARWALMIDPQLQGISWVLNKEPNLTIIQLTQGKYIDKVEQCIESGKALMIENLDNDIDAVLDPVVARQTIRRGRTVLMKLGDKEVEYDPGFRLYLQTKLGNPHYKPEIAAQTTLVNFCVTEKGLEDQLLALVVGKERPDLQEQAAALVRQLAAFTIQLKDLEDNLLFRLANSQGDILEDIELIENLEETKRTANDIAEKVKIAKVTEININEAREHYRPVANRGSLVYFLIDNLNVLDRVYQYSMANYVYVLKKGMDLTPGGPDESKVPKDQRLEREVDVAERVKLLIETTTYTSFMYIASGLFERDKIIVATQLTMTILKNRGELNHVEFDYLLRGPKLQGVDNPLPEWISDNVWASVQSLKEIEVYAALPDDIVGSAKRWKEWMELERPEAEPMPGDWKKLPLFQQLLLYRALRPDRLTNAVALFVDLVIGSQYTNSLPFNLELSYQDSSPATPIFIFLSPGVDVAAAVEKLGAALGFSYETGHYASVSLGQGQEPIAMNWLTQFHKNGGWVLLQNIHLTIDWTGGPLNEKVDKLAEGAHDDFRLFLSAEPPPILERGLPISLLKNSIKLTNEPPQGMHANLKRAVANFTEEMVETCAKQSEFKSICFALSYFHAAILERKKFGVGNMPNASSGIGWNMNYPFNTGDLLCCGQCAVNYLENNNKVPWADLKYIFGEIMYGGHIVEDWDRRLAFAYLETLMCEQVLEGLEIFPKFTSPPNTLTQKQVLEYIDDFFPAETPMAFGLHPNAEIGFRLREADNMCFQVQMLQPREAGGEGGMSQEDKAKMVLDDVVDRLPENFDMEDIRSKIDEVPTPYQMVAIQETERMNILLTEMKRSLAELDLGLKGDLTMSGPMELIMGALANDSVPGGWAKLAYPSLRPLASWMINLLARVQQLTDWTADLSLLKVTWISGLFNPQSFLTAVMQTTARRNDWPLDKTMIITEVTKKQIDQIEQPSRDGAFIHGLTLEGCRWDEKAGVLDDSRPKELFVSLPVMLIRAVTADKAELKDAYRTPVYKTERRFREEVFTAQLKSKHGEIKWTLTGACLFLDVVQ